MSYQTNKYKVGTVLQYKGNEYSVLDAFEGYPELTVDGYRSMLETDRQNRVNAFYANLSSKIGVNISNLILQGGEDRIFDLDGCPIADYYKVTPTANYGTAQTKDGREIYKKNDPVTLTTTPDVEERIFEGWYMDEECLHSERQWSFFATRDLSPKARYANSLYDITINGKEQVLLEVPKEGGVYTVVIASEGDGWSIANQSLPGWISISPMSGEVGKTTVRISITENNDLDIKTGIITFYNNGNSQNKVSLTITQQSLPPIVLTVTAYKKTATSSYEAHKYGVRLTLSEVINEKVKVSGRLLVHNLSFDFTCELSPYNTQMEKVLHETQADPDLNGVDMLEYSPESYNGRSIICITDYDES